LNRWLAVGQVAEEEQVSPRTVLRWIERGHLRARRQPGGRLRIAVEWYRDMIDGGSRRMLALVDDEGGSDAGR
jgi:excisionase family DNA binding protein